MKTIQRLSDENALRRFNLQTKKPVSIDYVTSNYGWQIDNGAISITGNDYYYSTHYVIEASPSSIEPMVLTLSVNDIFDADDEDQPFVFTCVAYAISSSITVNAKFYDADGSAVDGNSRTIQGGAWGAVRSNIIELTPPASAGTDYTVVLTISNHNNQNVRISTPNVVNDLAWANNPVIQNMAFRIPQFYESYDSREEDPTYPFFRYVDVMTDAMADTMKMYSEWYRYDKREIPVNVPTNTYETKSRLVDYEYVRDENIDWLSQFSGTKVKKQIYVGDSGIISDTDSFKRWQLYPAGYGRGAGTQQSLKEAVQFVLDGDKIVVISQRYGGDPWAIRITTKASETPGDWRQSVKAATTANIALLADLIPGSSIDGVTLADGDRVLVKNQTIASENGVYVVSAGIPPRSTDFDSVSSTEVATGALFIVQNGSANNAKIFELTTTGSITLGSTSLTFTEWEGSEEVLSAAEPARPLGYSITHKVVENFTLTLGSALFGVLGSATL